MADFADLPEEIKALLREQEALNTERVAALGIVLAAKRKEAVDARKESGVEEVWLKAEESYLGIDDTNRGEFANARWAKPTTMEGPLTTGTSRSNDEGRSSAFVRLTSRYVDAGSAKIGEILLPVDDKAFCFNATPVPELILGQQDARQVTYNGMPLERDARPGEVPNGAPSANTGQPVPLTVRDLAQEAIDSAQTAAKKAEKRIYDWMVESQYPAEVRKVIFDAARIGVGVLKGPFMRKRVSRALTKAQNAVQLEVVNEIVPAYAWIDAWNIYPDSACGEKIQDGDYLWEVDFFSTKQLRALKGQKGYIDAAIDKVIEDGPGRENMETHRPGEKKNKHRYAVWYFYGRIKKTDLEAAGGLVSDKTPEDVYAICTLVNDTVIRAVMNPLDSGEFPYHSVPWTRRPGHWAGVGIGEQISMPQRMINAATRALLNNAGRSAGSIIVADRGAIEPADQNWVLTPDKVFYKTADATADDVRKAFAFFQVPNMGPQLMAIIEYALRLAEESTSIPLVTQGQSGKTTPETYGATQLQNNNANQLLRSIGYAFDDYITEPVVRQSYEMLLLDDTVPDDEKGDWQIDAHGSTALVERAIQDQTVAQMGQFALNPAFQVDPGKWFAEFAKTKHLNPKTFQYSPEEQARRAQTPPPPAPQVQAAQIRAQSEQAKLAQDATLAQVDAQTAQTVAHVEGEVKLQQAQMKQQTDQLRIARDTDRDTAYVNAEAERTRQDGEARLRELEVKRELALLEYANKRDLKLDEVKAQLAQTGMKLQVEKELAATAHAVDLHKHHNPPPVMKPPVQVPGKAKPGRAFPQV